MPIVKRHTAILSEVEVKHLGHEVRSFGKTKPYLTGPYAVVGRFIINNPSIGYTDDEMRITLGVYPTRSAANKAGLRITKSDKMIEIEWSKRND